MSKNKNLDESGREILDPTPVNVPLNLKQPESMDQRIARILNHSASVEAAKLGLETFDEADDFDIEDDPIDPTTPWESDFDLAGAHAADRGVVAPPNITPERAREVKEKYSHKKDKKFKKSPPPEDDKQVDLEDAISEAKE